MNKLLLECNEFFKDCGFIYAIGGGWAFDLFLNKKTRPHADIDISIFDEDRKNIVEFMLNKGWNVYGPPKYLEQIVSSDDELIYNRHAVWTIKPYSSLIKLKPETGKENIYTHEVLHHEQLDFDFIEIIFNKQENGKFIFDSFISQDNDITREVDKAILYNNGVPYMAPEIMLFIISNPGYMDSVYHKEKNQADFDSAAPFLPKESREWLINAFETAYPKGHRRLEQLKYGEKYV